MPEPVIELEGVRKSYGTKVVTEVLHGIDLRVDKGEFVALVGPSGSGKSTLLHLLGLLDVPTSGTVRILGEDTATMDDARRTALRGRALGFIFQFHHLLPSLRAWENVAMPMAAVKGRLDGSMRERAVELLVRVGLEEKIDALAGDLSGGQQQRVAIARALAMRPPCVLADEPTGNLDTKTADAIFAMLREQNREGGHAFVIVTHDPSLASRCDRVIELVDGRILHDGSPTEALGRWRGTG